MARDKLVGILKHVNKPVHFTQDIGRQMTRGVRTAVQKQRHVLIALTNRIDQTAQIDNRLFPHFLRFVFLRLINRNDKRTRARGLLRQTQKVIGMGRGNHRRAFFFDRLSQIAHTGTREVIGTEIFVDDDDREVEFHGESYTGYKKAELPFLVS